MFARRTLTLGHAAAAGAVVLGALSVGGCASGADRGPVREPGPAAAVVAPPMSSADAARAAVTYLPACVGTRERKPARYTLTCADANYMLLRLRWTGWGADRAVATGIAAVNTCEPSCVQGTIERYPVRVVVDRIQNGEASAIYRRMTVSAVGRAVAGIPRVDVYRLLPASGPLSIS